MGHPEHCRVSVIKYDRTRNTRPDNAGLTEDEWERVRSGQLDVVRADVLCDTSSDKAR